MLKIKFLLLALTFFVIHFQSFAFTDIGGLFYSPETKESIYLEWDSATMSITTLHWAKGNKPYETFEIIIQYDKNNNSTNFIDKYVQILKNRRPTIKDTLKSLLRYELHLFNNREGNRGLIYLNEKNSEKTIRFMQIANQSTLSFNEEVKPNLNLVKGITSMQWEVYDIKTDKIDADTGVGVVFDEVLNRFVVAITEKEKSTFFLSQFEEDLSIKASIDSFDRSVIDVKLEIIEDKYWRLSFYDIKEKQIMTLLQYIIL